MVVLPPTELAERCYMKFPIVLVGLHMITLEVKSGRIPPRMVELSGAVLPAEAKAKAGPVHRSLAKVDYCVSSNDWLGADRVYRTT